jgi:hypothetical protein
MAAAANAVTALILQAPPVMVFLVIAPSPIVLLISVFSFRF